MKHVLLVSACLFVLALFVVPSLAQSNTINSVSVRGTSCNGGGGWAIVSYNVDGQSSRYLTASANSTISRNVSGKLPGSYVEEFYLEGMDLSAPDYAIRLTIRLGTVPSSSAFDMVSLYFDCRDGSLLIPSVDARDNRYTIPRNTPIELSVAANDISALPLTAPRILTQPTHANVVLGTGRRLIVTADSNYIGNDSFQYEICDISGLCDSATVRLNIVNMPPTCDAAADNTTWYWSPNHDMVQIQVNGVVDPDGDPFTLVITAITVSDVEGGSGSTPVDYDAANGLIRVERSGQGDGRTYAVAFDATDIWGESCSGTASIYVPHDPNDLDVEPTDTNSTISDTNTSTQSHGNANGNGSGNAGGRGSNAGNGGGNTSGNGNGGNANGNGNGRSGN
jgi:hypothetical protein